MFLFGGDDNDDVNNDNNKNINGGSSDNDDSDTDGSDMVVAAVLVMTFSGDHSGSNRVTNATIHVIFNNIFLFNT